MRSKKEWKEDKILRQAVLTEQIEVVAIRFLDKRPSIGSSFDRASATHEAALSMQRQLCVLYSAATNYCW